MIRELAGNHTIVLSTHILPEVAQTCKKIVIINKGQIVAVTRRKVSRKMHGAVSIYVQAQGPVATSTRAAERGRRLAGEHRRLERRPGRV